MFCETQSAIDEHLLFFLSIVIVQWTTFGVTLQKTRNNEKSQPVCHRYHSLPYVDNCLCKFLVAGDSRWASFRRSEQSCSRHIPPCCVFLTDGAVFCPYQGSLWKTLKLEECFE